MRARQLVSLPVCVCANAYVRICGCVHVFVSMRVLVRMCVLARMQACVRVCVCVCVCVRACVHACMRVGCACE